MENFNSSNLTAQEAKNSLEKSKDLENEKQLSNILSKIDKNIKKGWISYSGKISESVIGELKNRGFVVGEPEIDRHDVNLRAVTQISWKE